MSNEPAKPDSPDRRTIRIIFWRRIQGVGGLLLAASFVLPAVEACNSNIIPAEEVWDAVQNGSSTSLSHWAGTFLWFIAPYLFGLLTVMVVARGYRLRREPSATEGVSIVLLLVAVTALVLAGVAIEVVDDLVSGGGVDWELGTGIVTVLALLSVAYALRGCRLGPAGLLGIRWYVAVLCAVWFGYWFVAGFTDTCVGLWMSLAGAVLIIVAAHREAMACTGWPAGRTFWALLTCRLRHADGDEPRCRSCDYLLIGLTTPRCPECGQPFAWEEYGAFRHRSPTASPLFPPRR